MNHRKNTGHSVSSLFSLLLFGVFVLFLILMLLFSARIYQQTVKQTDSDSELGTAAKGSQASSDAGTVISQLSDFRFSEMENGFYHFSLESTTGVCSEFLLHRTGKKEAS